MRSRRVLCAFVSVLVLLVGARPAGAYSVLTHEALIDITWWDSIRPLLLERYPGLTPAQLREARAYAYGGCVIQDMGYYPFGKPFFSDLLHYVRTGDFIRSLFRNAHTADETAFAIGALAHYYGDTIGHPDAVNKAVANEFPALAAKYGPNVNYAEGPHQHIEAEFAFDVNDILKHRLAPERYLNHVGFAVPLPLLGKAVFETYGIPLTALMNQHRPTMKGYRWSVRTLLPKVAYAEAILYRRRMPQDTPGADIDALNQEMSQLATNEKWEMYRTHAGFGTHLLAAFIVILPKVGALRDLKLRPPNDLAEQDYVHSLLLTANTLRATLTAASSSGRIRNADLDTGDGVNPGTYPLEDDAYADLLHEMAEDPSKPVPFGIKRDLLVYFSDLSKVKYLQNDPKRLARVQADLPVLKTISTNAQEPDAPLLAKIQAEDDSAQNPPNGSAPH